MDRKKTVLKLQAEGKTAPEVVRIMNEEMGIAIAPSTVRYFMFRDEELARSRRNYRKNIKPFPERMRKRNEWVKAYMKRQREDVRNTRTKETKKGKAHKASTGRRKYA